MEFREVVAAILGIAVGFVVGWLARGPGPKSAVRFDVQFGPEEPNKEK